VFSRKSHDLFAVGTQISLEKIR